MRSGRSGWDGSQSPSSSRSTCRLHADVIDIGALPGHNFITERTEPGGNVFEAVAKHVNTLQGDGKRVVIALWSEGARERNGACARRPQAGQSEVCRLVAAVTAAPKHEILLAVLGVDAGIVTDNAAVITSRTFSATAWCARARPRAAPTILSRKRPRCRPAISSCMSIMASGVSSACSRSP